MFLSALIFTVFQICSVGFECGWYGGKLSGVNPPASRNFVYLMHKSSLAVFHQDEESWLHHVCIIIYVVIFKPWQYQILINRLYFLTCVACCVVLSLLHLAALGVSAVFFFSNIWSNFHFPLLYIFLHNCYNVVAGTAVNRNSRLMLQCHHLLIM